MKENIEVAQLKDVKVIVDMAKKLWPDNNLKELETEFIEIIEDQKQDVLLYKQGESYRGFIHVAMRVDYVEGTSSSPTGYIEGIFVEEAYRMKGIARALVQEGEQWSKDRGCKQMGSDVELHNQESLAFHKKIGYIEANRVVCFIKNI